MSERFFEKYIDKKYYTKYTKGNKIEFFLIIKILLKKLIHSFFKKNLPTILMA